MGSHDKQRIPLRKSFYYAGCGIWTAIKEERNFRIHLVAALVVLGAAAYFRATKTEWLVILFAIAGMLALELVNTAIERVVDLVTKQYHPLAKAAKDAAAGAVFLFAVFSVIIGIIIFYPYLLGR